LQAGTIDLPKARAISEATEVLDKPATAAVQSRVLPKATTQTVGELRAALSRAVLAADPDAANRRHRAARNDRRVQLHPHPDGMGAMWALLPADDATAAYARLDALARDMDADDPRGMDARRADILTDLLLGRDVRGERQTTVEVQVNLDAATLAGLADNPGELAGYGPIPAEMASELAAAARRWRAALIDENTGQLKDLSVAYRPRRLPDLAVRARDRTCCFPDCRQPAHRCDLDHTIPHEHGGPTAPGNLGPLCRHHHRAKTRSIWSLSQPEPALFIWTGSAGLPPGCAESLPAPVGQPELSPPVRPTSGGAVQWARCPDERLHLVPPRRRRRRCRGPRPGGVRAPVTHRRSPVNGLRHHDFVTTWIGRSTRGMLSGWTGRQGTGNGARSAASTRPSRCRTWGDRRRLDY
jgi:Domain of unknown function (DUF222)/HNH endonuclease